MKYFRKSKSWFEDKSISPTTKNSKDKIFGFFVLSYLKFFKKPPFFSQLKNTKPSPESSDEDFI
jgi:hypothetical protein